MDISKLDSSKDWLYLARTEGGRNCTVTAFPPGQWERAGIAKGILLGVGHTTSMLSPSKPGAAYVVDFDREDFDLRIVHGNVDNLFPTLGEAFAYADRRNADLSAALEASARRTIKKNEALQEARQDFEAYLKKLPTPDMLP